MIYGDKFPDYNGKADSIESAFSMPLYLPQERKGLVCFSWPIVEAGP